MSRTGDIADAAEGIVAGTLDPLTGIRRIVDSVGPAWDRDDDLVAIVEIHSVTDHYPGLPQRELWDPTALAELDVERDAYFAEAAPGLLEVCRRLAARRDEA